ncbi:MAG: nucleotide sugar dehydrogenase [Rhodospirillales bacterium]|nr:nucleotide sugar dehydrogenase [Rhodospirillales bacterium]
MTHGRKISVIGLGYVGLPVAVAFARAGAPVVAFDIDAGRVAELKAGRDRTGEVASEALAARALIFTADPAALKAADFHVVTVPTPIDGANRPDLRALEAASRTVGAQLKQGDIVVYESTVYPGATEETCTPLLEKTSGLACGRDFAVGYSPERINPGDREHRFETIAKVVSASDAATIETIARVYGSVVKAGIFRAASIKAAEAAKVIENTQRDLNIALMNELAIICHRLGLDTGDVLEAAATKWNFLKFSPGLVGGHCIGVDPYYLTHKAEHLGFHPQVILAGRYTNDSMGRFVAREALRHLMRSGGRGPLAVNVLGVTFKEDVPDFRNSKVADVVRELVSFGVRVAVVDPCADAAAVEKELGIRLASLDALAPADAVIVAVPHAAFRTGGWPMVARLVKPGGLVYDVRRCLDRAAKPDNLELMRL